MKSLELKTSKGTFMVIDPDMRGRYPFPSDDIDIQVIGHLSSFTDTHADLIVESGLKQDILKCYFDYNKGYLSHSLFTAVESLHSLIKSKGYYLFRNPKPIGIMAMTDKGIIDTAKLEFDLAEQKTFYDPIIIQILDGKDT